MARLLRTSERRTFTSCRQRWWWQYVEGLEPITPSPALRFGSLVHKALELYYPPGTRRGPHPAQTFEALYEQELKEQEAFGFRDEDGEWHNARTLGVALMEEYVRKYGEDERWEVVQSEMTFRVRLTKRLTYVGTFDGVWRDQDKGTLVLVEHKTAASIWADHLPLDEQAGTYWAFAQPYLRKRGILDRDESIGQILYNFIRKAMPDDRPTNALGQALNKDGSISKKQPSPIFQRVPVYRDRWDRQQIRARAIAQAAEMRAVRRGDLTLYKNPTVQNCRGCPFLIPCELHETGADYKPILAEAYKRYDPYSAHEIKEEGK